jgi:lysophospholipase L1-like esterase
MGFVPDVADDSHATTSVFERHPRSTAIVLMALAAALVLLLGEAIVRIAMPSVNFLGIDSRLFATAGEDGYGNAPGFSGRAFGAEVRIDREGFRAGGNLARQAAKAGDTVIFVGDSVTFGVGVQDARTFVELFAAAHPDVQTINAAVIGYSLEDYVVAVRRLLDRPGPTPRHVSLGFCLNDVSASSKTEILAAIAGSQASVSAAEGLLATVNAFLRERSKLYLVLKSLLIDSSHRYYSADASRYDDREAMKRALEALEEIKRMLAAREVGFTVLIFPYEYQFRAPDPTTAWRPQQVVKSLFERAAIDYIDLAPEFAAGPERLERRLSATTCTTIPCLSPSATVGCRPRRSVVGTIRGGRRSNKELRRCAPSTPPVPVLDRTMSCFAEMATPIAARSGAAACRGSPGGALRQSGCMWTRFRLAASHWCWALCMAPPSLLTPRDAPPHPLI